MKKTLILILLFCFGAKTDAQLPELGWSKEQVNKFMEGKYRYISIDTVRGVEDWYLFSRYAPVSCYGIEGELSIIYNDSGVVDDVQWRRGEIMNLNWPDRIGERLLSKPSEDQFLYLANSITTKFGKPTINKWSATSHRWQIKDAALALDVRPDSSVIYAYWITEIREKRKK